MKEIHAIRVTILLSYLVLVTRGKDFGTIGPWENTSKILIDRQVNKTIVVRTTTVLYIYNFLFFLWLTSRGNIKLDGRWRCL
jgi:preprotein translocase subunit SecG